MLAGAALNVPDNSLYLSPILRGNETGPVVIPLFYPRFWARVNATAATRELTLTITHTFELGGGMSGPISQFFPLALRVMFQFLFQVY